MDEARRWEVIAAEWKERAEQAEAALSQERTANTANIAELHRADDQIGDLKRSLQAEKTERDELHAAVTAARHQLAAAFGIVRSHASEEHVQHYQRAMMLCDAALARISPPTTKR